MGHRFLGVVTGLLVLGAFSLNAVAQRLNHNSYLGQQPPEIVSQREHWLGWHQQVTLAGLQGKLVWLQFNF